MRVARYMGGGRIAIVLEPEPECPPGGLLVRTEASGLCSGELMDWYMDRKIPHVLGHEVCGLVVATGTAEFQVGDRVFPHHHAPCMQCEFCLSKRYVHCVQWKRTKLIPGGMADVFAVSKENLTDTFATPTLRPIDAALIEPIACVEKSIHSAMKAGANLEDSLVIGLGSMGLIHMLLLGSRTQGFDLSEGRIAWALEQGLQASLPVAVKAETVFVCPGSQAAFDLALASIRPGGTIVMFAPLSPGVCLQIPQQAYFQDLRVVQSYSCGPDDTRAAAASLGEGKIKAEQVCSHFIELEDLPERYLQMKRGEILKPMVVWPEYYK